jgi:hypothetical protein
MISSAPSAPRRTTTALPFVLIGGCRCGSMTSEDDADDELVERAVEDVDEVDLLVTGTSDCHTARRQPEGDL